MSLLWIEGFENFGMGTTGSDPSPLLVIGRKYPVSGANTCKIATGRCGGYCMYVTGSNSIYYHSPGALTTNGTMVLGCAIKVDSLEYGVTFLSLWDNGQRGIGVFMNPGTGELSVVRDATILKTTNGHALSPNIWCYVELKATCGSSGSYELRINGVTVLSDTGVNTKAGTHDYHTTFRMSGANNIKVFFDDLYCLDANGSVNNDFLGSQKVASLAPNGDTASAQWTCSTGTTHYALVDENPINDDTDYVETNTPGNLDLFDYAACPLATGIKGVQISTCCKDTDTTVHSLITRVHSGSTDSDDAAQAVGSSYVTKKRLLELDPNGSIGWTQAAVSALQVGITL